jgi:hypothetical protein
MFKMLFTIALPIVILLTLSSDDRLGPIPALMLSLVSPIGFGLWEFRRSRTFDTTAAVGIVSVLLTGVIGIFRLSPELFAVKEAAVPILFATLIVISQYTRFPIVRLLFEQTIHKQRVQDAVDERQAGTEMNRTMTNTAWLWAASMAISGILRFVLAEIVVTSAPGTAEFNEQLGLMNLLRIPTVTVMTMVLMIGTIAYLVRSTASITGLAPTEFFRGGNRLASLLNRG